MEMTRRAATPPAGAGAIGPVPPWGPGPRAPAAGRLRLTVRGRRVVVALAVAGGLGLAALAGVLVPGDGSRDSFRLAGGSSVVVEPGDTLWSIAAAVAGDGDVRAVVHTIRRINGLDGAPIMPGQVLQLP